MNNDDFQKKIVDSLETYARHHTNKKLVMSQVFERIEQKRINKLNRWGFAGFALAAAITGFAVMPQHLLTDSPTPSAISVNTPKITPQLADDLDMLLVFGEDPTHGS